MILSDDEVLKRLSSPSNLMNKLKNLSPKPKSNAMDLFIRPKIDEPKPSVPAATQPKPTDTTVPQDKTATLDTIIQNPQSQIELGLAHNKSISLLNRSIDLLSEKLDDVLPSRLPSVISATAKVVESIRKERAEASKSNRDREVHYHFYTPQQRKLEEFEVIDVN